LSWIASAAPLRAEPARNFGDLSIEELMNETVTSVSKREQKLGDAASAISVLSNDDLRRSGATTIADALRLVPGMDVGSINSSQWAISARGFNSIYATKLLVLIDGRAVYSPTFAGVYWDQQQTMLEDVDRIEVIRGPGATVWGANAVNGVINVVTRSARDTQGGLIYAGGGDVEQAIGGARYGGRLGEHAYYRVFASHQARDNFPLANGQSAHDRWQISQSGIRVDDYPNEETHFTWQAEASQSDLEDYASDAHGFNTLGRWTHRATNGAEVELQAYYDHADHNELSRADNQTNTFDITAQHHFEVSDRNDIIWGIGYRTVAVGLKQTNAAFPVRHGDFDLNLASAFVQEEYTAIPDVLTLTAGAKLEHNDFTGFEFQPSVRALFKPAPDQTIWAAISRAVRTPDVLESRDAGAPIYGAPVAGPGGGFYLPAVVGNPEIKSETLWAYEIGYRLQATKRVSVDLAAFYNKYDDLIFTSETEFRVVPGVPFGLIEFPWLNVYRKETYGAEGSVTLSPARTWRMTIGATVFDQRVQGPAGVSGGSVAYALAPPKFQATLRSAWDCSERTSLDAQIAYVGAIDSVPAYVTADLRFSYRPTEHIELSIVGRNLLENQHLEQVPEAFAVPAEVPRGFYGKVTWRF